MSQSKIILIIVIVVIFGGISTYIISNNSKAPNYTVNNGTDITPISTNIVSTSTDSTTVKTYTSADVASHSSPQSCWSSIDGLVYDLSAWIKKHPGGDKAILSLCGIDGSKAFNSQHGGEKKPENILAGFDIGILKN